MYNNSMPLFRLDGKPVLTLVNRDYPNRLALVVRDGSDPEHAQGVDFYVSADYANRLERAVAAFNAAMQDEMANLPPGKPL